MAKKGRDAICWTFEWSWKLLIFKYYEHFSDHSGRVKIHLKTSFISHICDTSFRCTFKYISRFTSRTWQCSIFPRTRRAKIRRTSSSRSRESRTTCEHMRLLDQCQVSRKTAVPLHVLQPSFGIIFFHWCGVCTDQVILVDLGQTQQVAIEALWPAEGWVQKWEERLVPFVHAPPKSLHILVVKVPLLSRKEFQHFVHLHSFLVHLVHSGTWGVIRKLSKSSSQDWTTPT